MAINPHIYVSSVHGTNTGGSDTSYASQQTGAMTSLTAGNVYTNLGAAVAGASPAAGDTIYVADNHNATYDNLAGFTYSGTSGGAFLRVISVSASNIDQYSPGASDILNDGADDIFYAGALFFAGVTHGCDDNLFQCGTANSEFRAIDCTFKVTGGGDQIFHHTSDACNLHLVNCSLQYGGYAAMGDTKGGMKFEMYGGEITAGGTGATALFNVMGTNGGAQVLLVGVDLSTIQDNIIEPMVLANDTVFARFDHCRLNASTTLYSTITTPFQRLEFMNCDDSTGGDLHRFEVATSSGTAKNNDSTYVTTTEAWSYDGTTQSSIEVTTTASCSHQQPFTFDLPAQFIDLSDTASDVLTLNLVTDSTALSLTDTDIAAFIHYADGTTPVQANIVTSGKTVGTGNYGIDPLAAGTTLSTSSLGAADWTGEPASANFYKMDLDTTGDAGGPTVVSVRIEVYKASIASGDLFIHPILSVA